MKKDTKNFATHALELINYDPKLERTMRWLFGDTFICNNQDAAKKVTFPQRYNLSRNYGCRSITLTGDEYRTGGSLSGGSNKNFVKLRQAAMVMKEKKELQEFNIKIAELSRSYDEVRMNF